MFLPDGKHFLYMATAIDERGQRATPTTYLASFDSTDVRPLKSVHSKLHYAPPGFLLFVQDGTLMAQSFNPTALELSGEPITVAEGVAYFRTLGNAGASVSANGVLAYQGSEDPSEFSWYDRIGRETSTGWREKAFGSARISPDGQSVAVDVTNPRSGTGDIWIYDIARGVPTEFTSDPTHQSQPLWSPDQKRILFRDEATGAPSLRARAFDGTEEVLAADRGPLSPGDWSPDGKWIAYEMNTRSTGLDLWLLPVGPGQKPQPFLDTAREQYGARFSPDSRWIAFVSNEFGSPEVYVAPVTQPGAKRRISVGGGSTPRWRRDGKELFYVAANSRSIMSATVDLERQQIGVPQQLFTVRSPIARGRSRSLIYEVSPDGQRFLVNHVTGEPGTSRITIVVNWLSGLSR